MNQNQNQAPPPPPPQQQQQQPQQQRNFLELDSSKAGMQKVDREKVERILNDASRNSAYYQHQQQLQQKRDKRIATVLRKSSEFDRMSEKQRKQQIEEVVDAQVKDLLERTHLSRYCFMDMDMFYAAVEQLDQPWLRSVPFAVGGMMMLGTSDYKAREYGVRAAMQGAIAKKLCPELVLVSHHFEKYEAKTRIIRRVAAMFDPDFISMGGDELSIKLNKATFERARPLVVEGRTRRGIREALKVKLDREADVAYRRQQQQQQQQQQGQNQNEQQQQGEGEGEQQNLLLLEPDLDVNNFKLTEEMIVQELRGRIFEETGGLTSSAGLGPSRVIAKICSNFNKPNGQFVCSARTVQETQDFVYARLAPRQIGGVGKVTEQYLKALNINTVKELFDQRYKLKHCFTEKTFDFLLECSLGVVGAVKRQKIENVG